MPRCGLKWTDSVAIIMQSAIVEGKGDARCGQAKRLATGQCFGKSEMTREASGLQLAENCC